MTVVSQQFALQSSTRLIRHKSGQQAACNLCSNASLFGFVSEKSENLNCLFSLKSSVAFYTHDI